MISNGAKLRRVASYLKTILSAREALIKEGVVRSERDVIVDYVEWLAARRFKFKLAPSGVNKTFDAVDRQGIKYQIKARRVSSINDSTSFDFHNYDQFDYLIAVFIDKSTMEPIMTQKIPYSIVRRYWRKNRNRRSFRWNRKIRAVLDKKTKSKSKQA
jgi:hypothetical protein